MIAKLINGKGVGINFSPKTRYVIIKSITFKGEEKDVSLRIRIKGNQNGTFDENGTAVAVQANPIRKIDVFELFEKLGYKSLKLLELYFDLDMNWKEGDPYCETIVDYDISDG